MCNVFNMTDSSTVLPIFTLETDTCHLFVGISEFIF